MLDAVSGASGLSAAGLTSPFGFTPTMSNIQSDMREVVGEIHTSTQTPGLGANPKLYVLN